MDLYLDQEAFQHARSQLAGYLGDAGLKGLSANIRDSFEQLKKDWDTEAGDIFFEHFEQDLLENLNKHELVFEQIYKILMTASTMYEEVFSAAQRVIDTQI